MIITEGKAKKKRKIDSSHSLFTLDVANYCKRVREITLKSSSLTGVLRSKLNSDLIQFESSLERDFIYLLEFNKNVKFYLEQPIEIDYFDNKGKKRKYVPDFMIEYYDKKVQLVEIKYQSTLDSEIEKLQPKFTAAINFCKRNDYNFRVITEEYIRGEKSVQLDNFKFLHRYKNYFSNINKEETAFISHNRDVTYLYLRLKKIGKCTVMQLVNECARDVEKKAELIFLVWFLVSNNYFKVDFSKKMNLNTEVWLV